MTLNSPKDFPVLKHNLLEGNVLVVNLRPLIKIAKSKGGDTQALNQQLQNIKNYCLQYEGSVSKIHDSMLLITPNKQYVIEK